MKKMIFGLVLVYFFAGTAFGQEQKMKDRAPLKSAPSIPVLRLEDPEAREMGDDSQSPIYLLPLVEPEMLLGAPRGELKTPPPLPIAAKTTSPKREKKHNTRKIKIR